MNTSALGRIALATGITVLSAGLLPATAHADDAVVERRTLPVLVEFADSSFQDAAAVKASTPDTYFGAKKDSLASFFSELSRGKYRVVPAVDEQYVGPVKLSMAAACDYGEINTQTQKALAERGLVRGEDYDSLSMVFPAQKTGCDWAASAPSPALTPGSTSTAPPAGWAWWDTSSGTTWASATRCASCAPTATWSTARRTAPAPSP